MINFIGSSSYLTLAVNVKVAETSHNRLGLMTVRLNLMSFTTEERGTSNSLISS